MDNRRYIKGNSILRLHLSPGSESDVKRLERYKEEFLSDKYGDPKHLFDPQQDQDDFMVYLSGVAQEALGMAYRDPLTGVGTRHASNDIFEHERAQAARYGTADPHGIALVDLTMKVVNDRYGHVAGDDYLKWVADAIQEAAHRGTDVVARWGGDEFEIYMPKTDVEGTLVVANKVREGIERISDRRFGGHASGGVGIHAFVMDATSIDRKNVEEEADGALYIARNAAKRRQQERGLRREPALVMLREGGDTFEIGKDLSRTKVAY